MAKSFTDEQLAAIESIDRPLGLLAGAGSGKTTVLVHRYLRHLASGLKPRAILTVTFTNEAADQMRRRVLAELEHVGGNDALRAEVETTPYIGTLHGFCYGIVDQYGSLLGLPPIRNIATAFEQAHHFENAYREWLEALAEGDLRRLLGLFSHSELRSTVKALADARYALDRSLRHLATATEEEAERWRWLRAVVAPLFDRLEARYRAEGLYAFDDLENLALAILEREASVSTRLRTQFGAVLVDEFQDTSRLQWELLLRLLPEDRGKLFVVGDPKQSIYRFRDADYRLFLRVLDELVAGRGEKRELSLNFRSRPALVETVNALSARLFEGTGVPFLPMRPAREAGELPPLSIRRYASGERREDSSSAERPLVVAAVRERLAAGAAPGDIALLFRVSEPIPAFAAELEAAGIPATAKRTTKLFEHYDVVDVAAFVRCALDPLDDFRLASFLRSSFVRRDERQLAELVRRPGASLLEKLLGESPADLRWLFDWLETGPADLDGALTALFRNTGYYPGATTAWRELLAPLYATPMTLADAAARLDAWERAEILSAAAAETGGRGVRLMTVHGAKGLEFPHVFLVDLLRQPNRRPPPIRLDSASPPGLRYRVDGEPVASPAYERLAASQTAEDSEEARRILYVALTRAEETLTVFLPSNPLAAPKGSWGAWLQAALDTPAR